MNTAETADNKSQPVNAQAEPVVPCDDVEVQRVRVSQLPTVEGYPARGTVPISILVPVKNEQDNIASCLRRLTWAEQITVIDSQSTDDTIAISQALGAEVYQFHYNRETGWPKKKNWALEHVPWRHEWVLIVDADEHITPELAKEIEGVVTGAIKPDGNGGGDGYWINRRFMFLGRWLKGGGWYPSWNLRLFKHAVGRYERIGDLGDTGSGDNEVHEHPVLRTGAAGYLQHDMLHYAYPDLSTWIEKHNRYTTWEAHAWHVHDKGGVVPKLFGNTIERHRWLKNYTRHLPLRPVLRFLFDYFIRRGIFDGYPGFIMAVNMSWYEFMSAAKHREMEAATRQGTKSVGGPPA